MARSRYAFAARAPALAIRRQLADVAIWPTLLLLGIYIAIYVQFAAQLISFPFDLDQGEGYDAWSGWLLNLGQLPYTSNAEFPYYSSNYPPLWSYLVSIPMAWVGPGLGPARAVSTVAALLTAGCLGLAARRMSGSMLAAGLAAGFFLASPYVFHTTPLARVNGTALLFAVIGVSFAERNGRIALGVCCAAFVAALFTKQTTVDAVFATVLWLLATRWRAAAATAAAVGGIGLAGLALLIATTGGAFWLNVVMGNAQPFDVGQFATYVVNFGLLHCVLLALAAAQCLRGWRQGNVSVWVVYFATALLATVGVAKWGAGESYFLSAIAAACVLGACWGARMLESSGAALSRVGLAVALLLQAALLSHGMVSDVMPWLPDRGPQGALLGHAPGLSDRLAAERLVEQIRMQPGPALAEDPSFAVVAGEGVIGNATHLRNLYQLGQWDPTPMVNDLRARRYAIVVLNAELYPEPVLAAIGRFYFLDRAVHINGATYHVFLPGTD